MMSIPGNHCRWRRGLVLCLAVGALSATNWAAVATVPGTLSAQRVDALRALLRATARNHDPVDAAAKFTAAVLANIPTRLGIAAQPAEALPTADAVTAKAKAAVRAEVDRTLPAPNLAQLQAEAVREFPLVRAGETVSVTYQVSPVRRNTITGVFKGLAGDTIIVGARRIPLADLLPPPPVEKLRLQFDAVACEQQRTDYVAAQTARFQQERSAAEQRLMKEVLTREQAAVAAAAEAAGYIFCDQKWETAAAVVQKLLPEELPELRRLRTVTPSVVAAPPPVAPPAVAPTPAAPAPAAPVTAPAAAPAPPVEPTPPVATVPPAVPMPTPSVVVPPAPPPTTAGPGTQAQTPPPRVPPRRYSDAAQDTPVHPIAAGRSYHGLAVLAAALTAVGTVGTGLWLLALLWPEKRARSRFLSTRQEADAELWPKTTSPTAPMPFVACRFPDYATAFRVMTQLSYIEYSEAGRSLYSFEPLVIGLYMFEHEFVGVVAGEAFTYAMWRQAVHTFTKNDGDPWHSEPPALAVVLPEAQPLASGDTMLEFVGDADGDRDDLAHYYLYVASGRNVALAFLKKTVVRTAGVHVVVTTPDGHWGRDARGIYRE